MRMPSDTSEGPESSNPDRADPDWPAAVIAGAYQTGVLGVRSLVRRGVRACCFDCHLDYPGFRSVYGPAHACPDPDIDAQGWVNFMISLAGRMGDARDVKTVPGPKDRCERCPVASAAPPAWAAPRQLPALRRGGSSARLLAPSRMVDYAAAHVHHMQKTLMQMNAQRHHVVSDIIGSRGWRIYEIGARPRALHKNLYEIQY